MTDLKLDRIQPILQAHNVEDAWQALLPSLHDAGFDHVFYATNRLSLLSDTEDTETSLLLTDFPDEVFEALWTDGLYRTTPICRWMMENTGVQSLQFGAELYHAGALSSDAHSAQERFMRLGVTSGFVIGYNQPKANAIAGFAMINRGQPQEEADALWDVHGPTVETLCHIFHMRALALPLVLPHRRLTLRQEEVLRWVGLGKTTAEIADILGLSAAAIEKHLKRVREVLKVKTTTQAVLQAEIMTQLFSSNVQDT